ncbi:MAG: glycosyltransferase family 2 protein [Paludibacter sp.]|nr:glycosyltransferase family 2 protein [Paludibacter sp.]
MKLPELSIITVNYNGFADTVQLIESIQTHLEIPYEFIVVDNGSKADEAGMLKHQFPNIKVIRSNKNLGFAGGNNLGIKDARADFFLFINNDTYVKDDSLTHLVERMKKEPILGGISPKILFADQEKLIQYAGYTSLSPVTLRNRLIGFREQDLGQYDHPISTPYLHGAAMLIRREAIEKVGGIPEIYFLYYEELDWSVQLRRAGYRLEYNPSAVVYHKESSSVGQESPLKAFYMTRNRMLFAKRNLSSFHRFLSIAYQISLTLPKRVIQCLFNGKYDLAVAMMKGCVAFIRMK